MADGRREGWGVEWVHVAPQNNDAGLSDGTFISGPSSYMLFSVLDTNSTG